MSCASLEDLEARVVEARRVLEDCNRRLNVARRAARRQFVQGQESYLTLHNNAVAVAVYVLSEHSAAPAAEFIRQRRRARSKCRGGAGSCSPDTSARDAEAVEELYLQAPLGDITAIHYPATDGQRRIALHAKVFLAEARTGAWVREQTCRKSLPVRLAALRSMYDASLRHFDCPGNSGAVGERATRRWFSRLRVRWGLRRRQLQPEAPAMTRMEMQDKAGPPVFAARNVERSGHAGLLLARIF